MKTTDLVAGPQTDALVALARDWERYTRNQTYSWNKNGANSSLMDGTRVRCRDYSPSSTRAQWAELIEVFSMDIMAKDANGIRFARANKCKIWGANEELGLAICKAVIAAKYGDVIPAEIWEKVK